MNLILDGKVYQLENDMADYSWEGETPDCPECGEPLDVTDTASVWARPNDTATLICDFCGHEMEMS